MQRGRSTKRRLRDGRVYSVRLELLLFIKMRDVAAKYFRISAHGSNNASKTVIPAHHQGLVGTERRDGHFIGIIEQIMEMKEITSTNTTTNKCWLIWRNVRCAFKFASAKIGRAYAWSGILSGCPKMPIGAFGGPNYLILRIVRMYLLRNHML